MGNCFVKHRSGKKKLKTRSLYSFCTNINKSGTYSETISGIKYDIECVTVPEVTDDNVDTIFSSVSSNEGYFLLLKTNHINITKILTPPYPKKSLIIFCPTIEGTGTISMSSKGPNTLPEDILLFETDEVPEAGRVLIPAYANNAKTVSDLTGNTTLERSRYPYRVGNNGTGYNCGSGGVGGCMGSHGGENRTHITLTSGSGYSYGGGAGSAGYGDWGNSGMLYYTVDSTYPMRGGNCTLGGYPQTGGIGNPLGSYRNMANRNILTPAIPGVGGRLIIFCNNLSNLTLKSEGGYYNEAQAYAEAERVASGGSSGGGSINIFYTKQVTNVTTSVISRISKRKPDYDVNGSAYQHGAAWTGGAGGSGTIVNTKCKKLAVYRI